jgi:tripartite-type tricarboxylate transporter receptor subunit TctC
MHGVISMAAVAGMSYAATGAIAQPVSTGSGAAYPVKPIRMIVPFPPGGLSDGLARIIGQSLTQEWGQQVIVDNRPGAGTTLAADLVAKSGPDGYTLFFQDINSQGINAGLYRKLPYDSLTDFVPVAMASVSPLVLSVHPSLPVSSVKQLVALAKARPGEINYGSSGSGAILHLAGEMFRKLGGINLVHVPYKGSPPAVVALLSGEVALVFATTGSVLPHVRAGRIRALGVTTAQRFTLLPEIPPISEALPGYDLVLYQGILAPAKTPREIVAKLNAEMNRIMARPAVKESWAKLGAETMLLTPDEFAARYREEVGKLSRLAAELGVKVE